MSRSTRHFIRHYVEMVVVMLVGMTVLGIPAGVVVDTGRTGAMVAVMGATMTVSMVGWMRWRGHRWQPTLEMAGSMVVPTLGALALLSAGLVESQGLLLSLEHAVMFTAMLGVMLMRRGEYSHHAHGQVAA